VILVLCHANNSDGEVYPDTGHQNGREQQETAANMIAGIHIIYGGKHEKEVQSIAPINE